MVETNKSKRLVPVAQPVSSSINVPQSSITRILLAGAKDRGIDGVGDVLQKIGVQQQSTQDNLDAQNLLISKEAEFNEALIEADKIADPAEYKEAISKNIVNISKVKAKFGFFKDARIGDQVRTKIESLKQSAIAKSLGRTSVKQNDRLNSNYLIQSKNILEQGLIKGTPEAIVNAKLQNEEQANNVLLHGGSNEVETQKRIQKFNEGISMQGFLKAAEADPKGVNARADEFTKAFGLTQEQTTKAKFFVKGKAGNHSLKVKSLIVDVLGSAKDTGNVDRSEYATIRASLEGTELQEFDLDFENAVQINKDSDFLKAATPIESRFMVATLKKQSDAGGKGHARAKERFESAKANTEITQEGMSSDPYSTVDEGQRSLGTLSVFGARPLTLTERIDNNISEQRRRGKFGKDVKVLPKKDITDANGIQTDGTESIINKFIEFTPDQRVQLLDEITPKYGKHANKAFSQLMADGMPTEAALMVNVKDPLMRGILGSMVGTSTAQLKGALNDDDFSKSIIEAVSGSEELRGFVNSLQPFNSSQKESLFDTIDRLGLQMGTTGNNISDIVNRMENKLSRELYQYSGNTLRIARGEGHNIEKIEQFLAFEKNFNLIKAPGLVAGGVPIDLLQSQINRAQWYSNGDETGAKLYIDNVPVLQDIGDGVFVPVEVLYSDIEKAPFKVVFNEQTGFSEGILNPEELPEFEELFPFN